MVLYIHQEKQKTKKRKQKNLLTSQSKYGTIKASKKERGQKMAKSNILIVDVETAGTTEKALVYDYGGLVCNSWGEPITDFSFVIKDIFYNNELMENAYYANKIPNYFLGIDKGEYEVVSLSYSQAYTRAILKKYGITDIYAYNANFDRKALNNTISVLSNNQHKYFFPYGIHTNCIWHMACQVLATQKGYKHFTGENGLVSPVGNMRTSAEVIYAYMTGNPTFNEDHMGLKDCYIEAEIYNRCVRQKKKMNRGINTMCWRIPN
jgi:hypothetical protein